MPFSKENLLKITSEPTIIEAEANEDIFLESEKLITLSIDLGPYQKPFDLLLLELEKINLKDSLFAWAERLHRIEALELSKNVTFHEARHLPLRLSDALNESKCSTLSRSLCEKALDNGEFIPDVTISTLKAKKEERKINIYFNPLFISALSNSSLIDIIAHEYYHHLRFHDEMVQGIVNKYHKFYNLDSKKMGQLIEATELTVDCLTNDKLNIKELTFVISDDTKDLRHLFWCAVSVPGAIKVIDGCLVASLPTFESLSRRFGVNINKEDSFRIVFEQIFSIISLKNNN